MRLLGPVVVLLTVVLFVSGIELWLFGFSLPWLALHHGSFVLWSIAIGAHVLAYLRRAPDLALADCRRAKVPRRWSPHVVSSLLMGAVLAIAMLPFPSPFGMAAGQ